MEKRVQATREEVLEKTFSFFTEKWPHRSFVHRFDDTVQVTEDPSLGKGKIFMWVLASVLTGGFALVLFGFYMLTRQNRGLEQAIVEVSEDGEEVKIVTRGTPKYAARVDAWLEGEFPSRPSAVITYWASEEERRGSEQFEAGMSRNLSRRILSPGRDAQTTNVGCYRFSTGLSSEAGNREYLQVARF